MKAIKIVESNEAAIDAALAAANGKATAHTYTRYSDVARAAGTAESKLLLLVPKKSARGAVYHDRSGDALPNAYKYRRQVTAITLERRSSDWWLADVSCIDAYKEAGYSRLTLTPAQRDIAVARFCAGFSVAAAVEAPPAPREQT